MNHFLQFQKAISIEQKSENLFEFTPDKKYSVGATPNGGYLAAVMHKALVSVLPHSCSINSNVWYLDRTDHQHHKKNFRIRICPQTEPGV